MINVEKEFFYINISSDNDLIDQDLLDPAMTKSQRQALRHLEDAILSKDDVKIIKTYQAGLHSKITLRESRIIVAKARQRLIISQIIKMAIERNDDLSICTWFNDDEFEGSYLFSLEELNHIEIVIKRKCALDEFKLAVSNNQFESADQIFQQADLGSSNLFLLQDKQSLNRLKEKLYEQQLDKNETNIMVGPDGVREALEYSDEAMAQLWLDGKIIITQDTDHSIHEKLPRTIKQIGYNLRVEKALLKKDKQQLVQLIKSGEVYGYFPNNEIKDKVAAFLEVSG